MKAKRTRKPAKATKDSATRAPQQRTRKAERKTARAAPPPAASKLTVSGESFEDWYAKRQETDRAEFKLTRWSDRHGPTRGYKSTGDWFLTMAGCSFGDPEPSLQLMTIFNAITSELDVMAQLELLKRGARQRLVQKSGDLDIEGVAGDLYAPLSYLSQRCRALGEITSRILRANFGPRAAGGEK
ncbi:MAG TPA: hypothetical protein VHP33_28600 [Polyangiaceae bacterium]|nr:hypothetical protein [Polyangiaceae bacterium]